MHRSQSRARWLVVRALVRLTLLLAATRTIAGGHLPTGSIVGSVRETSTGRAAGMLRVRLTPVGLVEPSKTAQPPHIAAPDDDGDFRFGELEPGIYRLEIEAAGIASESITGIQVEAGETTRLEPLVVSDWSERITVRASPEAAGAFGLSHLRLTHAALDDHAASLQDPLRALAGAVGIVTQNDFKADLRIRGGDAADTTILADGLPIPNAYHFSGSAGSSSTLNNDLIQQMDVWSGGFSAEYGDTLAGVVEVTSREEMPARLAGEAGVGTTLAHATLRGPLGAGGWSVAGRASDLGLYADRVGDGTIKGVSFHDLMAGADLALSGAGRLGVTLQDGGSGFAQEFGLNDRASHRDAEHGARLRLEVPIDARTYFKFLGGHGSLESVSVIGAGAHYRQEQWRDDVRASILHLLGTRHALSAGFDLARTTDRIAGAFYQGDHLVPGAIDGATTTTGYFLEDLWRPAGRLALRLGARMDRFSGTGGSALSPRLGLELHPGDHLVLRASAGRFVQFPRPQQSFLAAGGEALTRQRADHFIIGLEQSWEHGPRILIEAYRKDVTDPIAELINLYSDLPEVLARFDRGRISGLDLSLENAAGKAWRIRLDASTMVARQEKEGHWFASNTDQRYSLSLNAGHDLGRGWDLSGTLRYASGLPYTAEEPWVSGAQVGAILGELNGARLPSYSRLDLRFTRSVPVSWGRLRVAIDLLNVTNRRNVRSIELAYDENVQTFYRISRAQSPFLPVFSLTTEF